VAATPWPPSPYPHATLCSLPRPIPALPPPRTHTHTPPPWTTTHAHAAVCSGAERVARKEDMRRLRIPFLLEAARLLSSSAQWGPFSLFSSPGSRAGFTLAGNDMQPRATNGLRAVRVHTCEYFGKVHGSDPGYAFRFCHFYGSPMKLRGSSFLRFNTVISVLSS
jgi:hypothetical protein